MPLNIQFGGGYQAQPIGPPPQLGSAPGSSGASLAALARIVEARRREEAEKLRGQAVAEAMGEVDRVVADEKNWRSIRRSYAEYLGFGSELGADPTKPFAEWAIEARDAIKERLVDRDYDPNDAEGIAEDLLRQREKKILSRDAFLHARNALVNAGIDDPKKIQAYLEMSGVDPDAAVGEEDAIQDLTREAQEWAKTAFERPFKKTPDVAVYTGLLGGQSPESAIRTGREGFALSPTPNSPISASKILQQIPGASDIPGIQLDQFFGARMRVDDWDGKAGVVVESELADPSVVEQLNEMINRDEFSRNYWVEFVSSGGLRTPSSTPKSGTILRGMLDDPNALNRQPRLRDLSPEGSFTGEFFGQDFRRGG